MTGLSQDQIDDVLFAARAGELEGLEQFFNDVDLESLKSVRDEYTGSTPLHMAAANGHTEVVEFILKHTGNDKKIVNAQNESGNTALHWAALNGHLDVVKVLCDAQGDPFIKNAAGHDVFYEAEINAPELDISDEGEQDQHEHIDTVIDYLLERYNVEPEDDGSDEVAALSVKPDEPSSD
jgi:hypothetical protein